jgi:uncharacterized protein
MSHQPFHEGELAVQERAGERDMARRHGAIISSRIVPGALTFLAQQRLIAVTAAGDDGDLWTTVWCGEPGFIRSPDGQRVSILPALTAVPPGDPVRRRLTAGRDVGLLAIEFASRRRLRINGTVESASADEIAVHVRESVPNCPKYIHRRQPHEQPSNARHRPSERGGTLDEGRRALVERADTAFVGSLHPVRGADASHRGGPPGFISVVDAATLRVPDYPGNSMFMTLGNFEVDPRAALAVVDFAHGSVVSCSGSAGVHIDGGSRYWEFTVREWMQFDLPSTLRWESLEK